MWFIRGCAGVRQVWETIYGGEKELLVSYDGMSLFRPWTVEPSWRTDGPWYHTDQPAFPPKREFAPDTATFGAERHYVQGFVNLVDNSEVTGGNGKASLPQQSDPAL